jgi:acyl-CoA synthetase (AMP-forming)/AMP-acid ligase II
LSLNSDRYLECMFAVLWANGVLVPMNIRWSVAENVYSIEDSTPQILLVDDAFLPNARAICEQSKQIKHVIYIGESDTPPDLLDYEDLLREAGQLPMGQRGGDDLAGIFYTGGTTGFPKGVMLSHANLLHSALYGMSDLSMDQNTVYLHAAPMFHLADGSNSWGVTLFGGTHTFIPRFDAEETLRVIDANGVTFLLLVPTMLQMLFDHPRFTDYDISSLELIIYGASPMPQALLERIMQAVPNVQLVQGYGQTELAPVCTLLLPRDHQLDGPLVHRRRSVGRPAVGIDVKIVDEELDVVPPGETGQIAVRGKNTMIGYWNKPEQTASTLVGGWVLTGDAGYFDDDGYLYLVDRVKDMIITGGENVFSVEVENALTDHPGIQSAAVIGIPSKEWGESVHGIVIADPVNPPTEQQLIDHCRDRIAGYKCPKSITFREDDFPLSGAGKVLKTELRKPFWQGHSKNVN